MSTKDLAGCVALISGASSGIGLATALRLADEGAAVALVARRSDRLDELTSQIRQAGGVALPIAADLTDAAVAEGAVARAVAELGRLDILINNAGVMLNGPSDQSPLQEWDRMVDINVRGLMYTTKAALPHLLKAAVDSPRSVADVVNISSVAGRFAAAGNALYNATKFAVTGATEAWRQEFTTRNVRFSVVEPGRAESELFGQKEGQHEGFVARFGEIEVLHAEDIARSISFIVTSPRRVAINEIVIRPTDQA
jgi:NADP-dependent 3-hydroxy acid dehydrogenase YdfG